MAAFRNEITDAQRERVRRALQSQGVRATSRVLGVARDTTLAVAAGAPVRRGSAALVVQNINELAE